jgi:hypothetical protein
MEAKPAESETIVTEFKKGRAKREAKRKQVQVITEFTPPEPEPEPYVPAPPSPVKTKVSEAVEVPSPVKEESIPVAPEIDVDSIADRVAEKLFAKMAVEKVDMDKTPESKTKPRPRPPPKKKEEPPAKYFGWC